MCLADGLAGRPNHAARQAEEHRVCTILVQHLAQSTTKERTIIPAEETLQVIDTDQREVARANLRRLTQHGFVDPPGALLNLVSRVQQSKQLGLAFDAWAPVVGNGSRVVHQSFREMLGISLFRSQRVVLSSPSPAERHLPARLLYFPAVAALGIILIHTGRYSLTV